MEVKYWTHPEKVVVITVAQEESTNTVQLCIDGGQSEEAVGAGKQSLHTGN
jgi:hypothetical protein